MLTNDELQAIRARCEAATPGPWTHRAREGRMDRVHGSGVKTKPPEKPGAMVMSAGRVESVFTTSTLRSFS